MSTRKIIAHRRRDQEHAAFEGRVVVHKEQHGRRTVSQLGVVHYEGSRAGLKCFKVIFKDGSSIMMSAAEVRHRLMPEQRRKM